MIASPNLVYHHTVWKAMLKINGLLFVVWIMLFAVRKYIELDDRG